MNVTLTTTGDTCSPVATHAIGIDAATSVAATLKALSDPLRLRMLSAIASDPRGESCVCDLAELADVSQPTVSHHLKLLREAGLVHSEKQGLYVYYRVNRNALNGLRDRIAARLATLG